MTAEKLSTPPFAPLRRVITGHTDEGKPVVAEDEAVLPHTLGRATNETYFTDIFWRNEFPSGSTVEFKDLAKGPEKDFFSENGSSFRLLEFPPGGAPSVSIFVNPILWTLRLLQSFHRTVTIDYGIVVSGSLALILDNDKRAVLRTGDVIVQRGTIHGWVKEGTEWARVFFVLLRKPRVSYLL